MRGRNLFGRMKALEEEARKQEHPRAVYLRVLFAFLATARAARETGDQGRAAEAEALRVEMEALAQSERERGRQ